MQTHGKKLPGFVMAAYLKSVTNSWVTTARFGNKTPCPYSCGEQAGANMEHLVSCPAFHAAAATLFRHWSGWPLSGDLRESMALHMPMHGSRTAVMLIWHDVALQTYLAHKHGDGVGLATIIRGRVRAVARHSTYAKAMLLAAYG